MTTIPPQSVQLTCPVCGALIQAQVHHLVDVGQDPSLKERLLRGRINAARCANCGGEGIIAAPLIYHDPEKELLLVFIPPELDLPEEERQRIIGDVTNLLLSTLPPEKRKGYLLLPRQLLSYQGLLDAVLEAEGIPPEVLERQRQRLALIERLRQALPDEERLRTLIAEGDEDLNFEFFALLGTYIEANRQDGQTDLVAQLESLREHLLQQSTYGRQIAAQAFRGDAPPSPLSREELLERLLTAPAEERVNLITWHRGAVDYVFFQMLTERIAQAEGAAPEEAARLRTLREEILQTAERVDQETRAALERAAGLLRLLLKAEDPEALIRERLDEIDEAFFVVLGVNLEAAEEAGQAETRRRLQELGQMILRIAQERLPPHVRLIRQMLDAPDEATLRTLEQENAALLDEHLVALMRQLAEEVQEAATAARLRELAGRVEDRLGGEASAG